jgi:hypothetical protein
MARYFSKQFKNSHGYSQEQLTAYGKHNEEAGGYPASFVSVEYTPTTETPNFNFQDAPERTAFSNTIKRSPEVVDAMKNVDRAVGFDGLNTTLSEPNLRHTYNQALRGYEALKNTSKDHISRKGLVDDYAKSISKLREGTSQLFTHAPARAVVDQAYSHSSMRATVPIMASYIHKKYGTLEASDNLSEHSARMVEHARQLGLPVQLNDSSDYVDVTNDIDFDDEENVAPRINHLNNARELTPEEIRGAKEHYKELRGLKRTAPQAPKNIGPQFTQLQLPGMES